MKSLLYSIISVAGSHILPCADQGQHFSSTALRQSVHCHMNWQPWEQCLHPAIGMICVILDKCIYNHILLCSWMLLSVLTHYWPLTHYLLHVCSQVAWVIKGITMTIHATVPCGFNKLHDHIRQKTLFGIWLWGAENLVPFTQPEVLIGLQGIFSQGYWCINSCGEY